MNEKLISQTEQLTELKAKLEIYEKWHNIDTRHSQLDWESRQNAADEIDLRNLWDIIWQGKWKITAITSIFVIASVFYALSLPNVYKSEALLMPNIQEQTGGGLGNLAGQFGGLASLAGISFGGGSTDKTAYALEVLKSREFLYKFIEEHNLKKVIFAVKSWNRDSDSFSYDGDIYNIETNNWVRKEKSLLNAEPTIQEVYEVFTKKNLSIVKEKDTNMVKLAVNHFSPYLARELVEQLIISINDTIKSQDMAEATKSIEYFEKELSVTNIAGAQNMFYQLIEQQQQKLMLTKVRDDYVFKIVDKAVTPEKKDSPKRLLICVIGTLIGALLSVSFIILRYFIMKEGN